MASSVGLAVVRGSIEEELSDVNGSSGALRPVMVSEFSGVGMLSPIGGVIYI